MIIVRSQNREVIIKCRNIQVVEQKDKSSWDVVEFSISISTLLGQYKTKETAIEVLGNIQSHIHYYGTNIMPFNMPEDEVQA